MKLFLSQRLLPLGSRILRFVPDHSIRTLPVVTPAYVTLTTTEVTGRSPMRIPLILRFRGRCRDTRSRRNSPKPAPVMDILPKRLPRDPLQEKNLAYPLPRDPIVHGDCLKRVPVAPSPHHISDSLWSPIYGGHRRIRWATYATPAPKADPHRTAVTNHPNTLTSSRPPVHVGGAWRAPDISCS